MSSVLDHFNVFAARLRDKFAPPLTAGDKEREGPFTIAHVLWDELECVSKRWKLMNPDDPSSSKADFTKKPSSILKEYCLEGLHHQLTRLMQRNQGSIRASHRNSLIFPGLLRRASASGRQFRQPQQSNLNYLHGTGMA